MRVDTLASGMFHACVCYIQGDLFYLLLWSMKFITLGNYKKKKFQPSFLHSVVLRFWRFYVCISVLKKKPNWLKKNMGSKMKSRTYEPLRYLTLFFPRWKPNCAEWKRMKFRFKPSICLLSSYVRLALPEGEVFLFQKLKMDIKPTPDRQFCF